MLQTPGIEISITVMVVETLMLIAIFVGWYRGARRLDFKLHHLAVYSIVLVHVVNVALWMIPQALSISGEVFGNPVRFWYVILHDSLGIITLMLAIVLVLLFILKPGMPLRILRRARPVMIIVLIVWIVTFAIGGLVFLLKLLANP